MSCTKHIMKISGLRNLQVIFIKERKVVIEKRLLIVILLCMTRFAIYNLFYIQLRLTFYESHVVM